MSNTPSDEEILVLAQQHLKAFAQFRLGEVWFEGEVEFARAVLAKWGQPAQAAEPVAWLNPWRADQVTTDYDAYGKHGIPLVRQQPVEREPVSDDVVKDAARYRWLREGNDAKHGAAWHVAVNLYGCEWDAAIDAAIAAQGGKV